jgi:hypothetical protein
MNGVVFDWLSETLNIRQASSAHYGDGEVTRGTQGEST